MRILGLAVLSAVGAFAAGGSESGVVEAAKSGDKATLRALIQKKADVNVAQPDGTTALHWASYHDDLESADLLIRAGAEVKDRKSVV